MLSLNEQRTVEAPEAQPKPEPSLSTLMLETLERCLHPNPNEWLFLRELRVGTGFSGRHSLQRLDAFALNCYQHRAMRRVCYELKISRGDFLNEVKHPLKRRIGMRYSNEFYFVTPGGLLDVKEVPVDCGLIETGETNPEEWKRLMARQAGFFHFDPATGRYCIVVVPAPWRETPGPTWELVAAMMRNQRRRLEEQPPPAPAQQKIAFD